MSAARLSCEGIVLGRSESGEKHCRLEIFSPEHGGLVALARRGSSQRPQTPPPDLFALVALELERSSRGSALFVREARHGAPFAEVARHYRAFLEAGAFARVVWRNLAHAETFEDLYALTLQALSAFTRGIRPEVTHFKSLYLFARLEGYPVKEQMLASWPAPDRALAQRLLTEPLHGDQPGEAEASALLTRLQQYLRASTDILV